MMSIPMARKPKTGQLVVVKKNQVKRAVRKHGTNRKYGAMVLPFGFPQSLVTKFTYVENHRLTAAGAGLVGNYVIRANDLTDPRFAVGGHQAYMLDTFTALYSHYCVLESRITCYVSTADPNVAAQKFIISAHTSSTAPTDMELEEERKFRRYTYIATGSGAPVKKVSYKLTTGRMYGVSQSTVYKEDDYWADLSAGTSTPLRPWFFHLSGWCMNTAQASDLYINFHVEYTAKLIKRKPQSTS